MALQVEIEIDVEFAGLAEIAPDRRRRRLGALPRLAQERGQVAVWSSPISRSKPLAGATGAVGSGSRTGTGATGTGADGGVGLRGGGGGSVLTAATS